MSANDDILTKEDVSEILLSIDAVNVSLTHPFEYASGLKSPIYTNCRVLLSHTKERNAIIDTMIGQISDLREKIDIVASTGTSSIFLASLLAERLELPMVYVRSGRKAHGKRKEIEGVFRENDRVLLVSDIISTERDIPNSVEVIRKNGGIVVHCIAVFNNNMGTIDAFLEKEGIRYSVLSDLKTLLEIASKKRRISSEEKVAIEDWAKDPERWNEKRLTGIEEMLGKSKRRIAQILLEIGAVTINTEQPFKYTSGLLSPIYTDNRLLISYPDKWRYIIDSFVDTIVNIIGLKNFDIIAGTATSGIPQATLIGDRLGSPMVYVKFERDDKGEHTKIAGKMKKGDRVIMIEDHVTTGKSVLSAAKILRDAGAKVDWCVAIFTYDITKSRSTFAQEEMDLITLCDLPTLMDVAIQRKFIKPEDQKVVFDWLENPEYWGYGGKKPVSKLHESTSA